MRNFGIFSAGAIIGLSIGALGGFVSGIAMAEVWMDGAEERLAKHRPKPVPTKVDKYGVN